MHDFEDVHPPACYINMRRAPTIWTPHEYQIVRFPNRSLLNSYWIGIVVSLGLLPYRILNEFILNLLFGNWLHALFSIIVIPMTTITWILWGLSGCANAVNLSPGVMAGAHIMTWKECNEAIEAGYLDMMIEGYRWRPSDPPDKS